MQIILKTLSFNHFFTWEGELGNGTTAELSKVANNAIPKLIAKGTFPSNFIVHDTAFNLSFFHRNLKHGRNCYRHK